MNSIPGTRATANNEINFTSVERNTESNEFKPAENISGLQSAVTQIGEKIASLVDAITHAVNVSPAVSTPNLRSYGAPHPNTRFAKNLDPAETFFNVTNVGLPNGIATTREEQDIAKANRPAPETYLDAQFMKEHLALFDEGAVTFINTTSFRKFTVGYNAAQFHGRSDGLFVMPAKWAREMVKDADSDPSVSCHREGSRDRTIALIEKIERKMGIPAGCWSKMVDDEKGAEKKDDEKNTNSQPKATILHENLFAVYIENPKKLNLRFTAGTEQGANIEWRPGGYTLGGVPEACVDKVGAHDGVPIPVDGLEHVLGTWNKVHNSSKEPKT